MSKKSSGSAGGSLVGNNHNNTFTVTASTTSIDGMGGINTAIFAGDISGYTIAPSASEWACAAPTSSRARSAWMKLSISTPRFTSDFSASGG